jgi:hypothetical protein
MSVELGLAHKERAQVEGVSEQGYKENVWT